MLSNPNFNLYKFQKVPVIFSVDKQTPSNTDQFLKRLTGDWLISDIEFIYDGSKLYQKLKIIKTEMSMSDDEKNNSVAKREQKMVDFNTQKSENLLTSLDQQFVSGTQSIPQVGLSI